MKKTALFFLLSILLISCGSNKKSFELSNVKLLNNLAGNDSIIKLSLDLSDAVLNGIEIPAKNQTKNGYFNFSFKIKNTTDRLQRFFYKIYYQNESYKFDEKDILASENFYGSWENTKYIFKATRTLAPGQETEVTDSFKIVGNPRDEKIFFGSDPYKSVITEAKIQNTINYMKTIPEWVKQLEEKSRKNKISVDEQFYVDALWSLNDQKQRDSVNNNRWKRNPRIGQYKFVLVITTPEDFDNMPTEVKNITCRNSEGNFVNPFSYFKSSDFSSLQNTQLIEGNKKLLTSTRLDLSRGIYINPLSANKLSLTKEYFTQSCSDSADKYKNAQIELYFHNINKDYVLRNIPEIRDVLGENFSRKEYGELLKKYEHSGKLLHTYVNSTDCPCKNTVVNKNENSITIKNPGNKEGEFKKEHVGIQSRIGFTYGKFRAKIKFTELINKDNVWNGITNAFWMMAQDVNSSWNMRRPSTADIAYIPKSDPDTEASLWRSKKQITYSEIDFEILKESEFWPKSSYGKKSNVDYQTDDCANNNDIMVTCTNWDMANHEPKNFGVGAIAYDIDNKNYIFNRWNQWSKALTAKIPAKHDEIFKAPYYYFEIEWTPEKITWRIGPEKNKMRTICVMDKNISSIPGNQMIMIITQEWHNQEWWPTAPYKQNFIPFPKNDIIGKVLELEIE